MGSEGGGRRGCAAPELGAAPGDACGVNASMGGGGLRGHSRREGLRGCGELRPPPRAGSARPERLHCPSPPHPPPPSPSLSPSPSASLFIPAFPSRSSPRCYRPVPQCRAVPSPAAVRFPPPIPHLTFSFCLQSRSGAALPALHPARSAPGARGVKRFPAGPQQQEEEEEEEEGDLRPPSAAFSEYG